MERNERVQSPKDLSQLTLCHDVQLQHGLIVYLAAHTEWKAKEKNKPNEVQKVVWQSGTKNS